MTMKKTANKAILEEGKRMLLSVLSCVIPSGGAIYLSTPITNGLATFEFYKRSQSAQCSLGEEYQHFLEKTVIPNNMKAARIFAEKLRSKTGEIVIDPAGFFEPSWPQSKYLDFWKSIIEKYAKSVFFNDGWCFSKGCVYEYFVAHNKNIPTFDSAGKPLDLKLAINLVAKAIKESQSVGIDVEALSKNYVLLTQTNK